MIYLITGVPGSGKTLYAVSTLVQKLAGEKLKKRGQEIERRVVVDGIPDLVMPHERMADVVEDDKGNLSAEGDSVLNWFEWCKPGDVLVIDEVQRHWRPRGMGTKPPPMIKALETHRHLGVDFVIITQNPMLIDQNVRRLVGRHQHIRRLLGLQRAVIYDWDGCSVDVHRTKLATSSMWSYPKSAYELYKSSELHTKQKQKVPLWLAVPVLALVGFIAVAPTFFNTMYGAMTGKGVARAQAPSSVASQGVAQSGRVAQAAGPVVAPSVVPVVAPGLASDVEKPVLSGCILHPVKGCVCMDQAGRSMDLDAGLCADLRERRKPVASWDLPDGGASREVSVEELDSLRFVFTAKQRGPRG